MLKSKLLAIIGGSMSVVVAASAALTLALSGPRNVLSLHALSDNEAVAYGVSNLFSSATSGVDAVTEVIDTIAENKASIAMGFDINEIVGLEEISGLGAGFDVKFDTENEQYSLLMDVNYGAIEIFNGLIYMDEKDIVGYVPALFEGIITASYDNLVEDMQNSYIGSLLEEEGFDFEEYRDELTILFEEFSAEASELEIEFDYEDFSNGLMDTINSAYLDAMNNMDVTDNGMQPLNGGSYQSYTAKISVADLSYIIKDSLVYILDSDEFQDYLTEVYEYSMSSLESEYADIEDDALYGSYGDLSSLYGGMDIGSQIGSISAMIDSYWGMIITELEAFMGKDIQFTIYLTEAVETAGFELYFTVSDDLDSISFTTKSAVETAPKAVAFTGDFTGGKEIGDYTYIGFKGYEYGDEVGSYEYSYKMEENGDFTLDYTGSEADYSTGLFHIDGNYTENGQFFSLDVDSLKYVDEYNETLFDIGFHFSFESIDGVDRPSATPEYNIWEMDEEALEELINEINENLEELEESFN